MANPRILQTIINLGEIEIPAYSAGEDHPAQPGNFVNYLSGAGLAASIGLSRSTTLQSRMSKELKAMLGPNFSLKSATFKTLAGGTSKFNLWTIKDSFIYYCYHALKGNKKAGRLADAMKSLQEVKDSFVSAPIFSVEIEKSTPSQLGYVYMIGWNNSPYVKIGSAKNPIARLKGLQTGNPYRLSIEKTIKSKNSRKLELKLHQMLDAERYEGEWFARDAASIVFATELTSCDQIIAAKKQ